MGIVYIDKAPAGIFDTLQASGYGRQCFNAGLERLGRYLQRYACTNSAENVFHVVNPHEGSFEIKTPLGGGSLPCGANQLTLVIFGLNFTIGSRTGFYDRHWQTICQLLAPGVITIDDRYRPVFFGSPGEIFGK